MHDKNNIEDLFKDTFRNFEEPVRPELWQHISNQIHTPPQATVDPSAAGSAVSGNIISSAGTWIAGAALVVIGVAGYVILNNNEPVKTTEAPTTQVIQKAPSKNTEIVNEITTLPSTEAEEKIITPVETPPSQKPAGLVNSSSEIEEPEGNSVTTTPAITTTSAFAEPAKPVTIAAEKNISPSQPKNEIPADNTNNQSLPDQPDQTPGKIQIIASPPSGKAQQAIRFTFAGKAETALWDFGDGTTAVGTSPLLHIYDEPGTYLVALTTTDLNGKSLTSNYTVEVSGDEFGTISNIITPNGDGLNDVFRIESTDLIDFEGFIYDQSGKIIFHWTDINSGWNGKLNSGQEAQEGTYLYAIFATGPDKKMKSKKGTLRLAR